MTLFIVLQYKTCKDGSVLGVTVTRIALLTHCQALTQSCGYTEGESHKNTHRPGQVGPQSFSDNKIVNVSSILVFQLKS